MTPIQNYPKIIGKNDLNRVFFFNKRTTEYLLEKKYFSSKQLLKL